MNQTYRVELADRRTVIARAARHAAAWFTDEAPLMTLARDAGVPTPEVLGVDRVDRDGQVLSVSIQRLVPGRPLDKIGRELSSTDRDRLVVDAGELLARIHSVVPDRGIRHQLRLPEHAEVARVAGVVGQALGAAAARTVEVGADLLRREVASRRLPPFSLAHGDFMPKNLLIDGGSIVGVIDWEFAGPAPPAFDLARWEVSAGGPWHDLMDLLWRGYARVTDPERAASGLVPAFAIDWALEKLGWRNPAPPAQVRRCVDVIARYAVLYEAVKPRHRPRGQ